MFTTLSFVKTGCTQFSVGPSWQKDECCSGFKDVFMEKLGKTYVAYLFLPEVNVEGWGKIVFASMEKYVCF